MHPHLVFMVAPIVLTGRDHSAKSCRKQATRMHCRQLSFHKAFENFHLRCLQSPNTSDVVLAYGADGQCENTVISFDTPAQSAQGFRDFGTPTTGPGPDIPLYTAMFDGCEPSQSHACQHKTESQLKHLVLFMPMASCCTYSYEHVCANPPIVPCMVVCLERPLSMVQSDV